MRVPHLRLIACCALAGAFALAAVAPLRADPTDDWETVKRLITAAYFSDTCRQQAGALGIAASPDARTLIAAFAQRIAAAPPDLQAAWRLHPDADDCGAPVVALINLLRRNGVDAEIAFITMPAAAESAATPAARARPLMVYVPALDRYLDPVAPESDDARALDGLTLARTLRTHVVGPLINTASTYATCRDVCLVTMGGPDDRVHVMSVPILTP